MNIEQIKLLPLPAVTRMIHTPCTATGRVEVVSMSDYDVLSLIYPGATLWGNEAYIKDSYESQSAKVIAYADAHKLHYYGRPKEDFFLWEAAQETVKHGFAGVILDNMS